MHDLINGRTTLVFMWLLGHFGLPGDVAADTAAKAVLSLTASSIPALVTDFHPSIVQCMRRKWQGEWDAGNYFSSSHRFPRNLGFLNCRVETHLNGSRLTVELLLLQCIAFSYERQQYFNELFNTFAARKIVDFIIVIRFSP